MPLPDNQPGEFFVLFCESVRSELGGKLTLMGMYAGGCIGIPAGAIREDRAARIPGLSVIFCFLGGEGEFSGRVRIIRPNGDIQMDEEVPQRLVKKEGVPMNVINAFSTFDVSELGRWTVTMILEGQDYSGSFLVYEDDDLEPAD
jgi:hypothetical protein